MTSDLFLLLPVLGVLAVLILLRLLRRDPPVDGGPPENAIAVDGSNVMHWGGEPSVKVLEQVLRAIEARGQAPIVFFDANVGYKLFDRYYSEAMLATVLCIPQKHILVAHKGVVADEWILDFATKHGLRVVSNDKFRDWSVRFPLVRKKGWVLRGIYRDGTVVWGGKRRR
jgi:hypothetical protein